MKHIFLTIILILLSTNAFAASASLPVMVKIINLTQMPIEEAIAFCNERNLACPDLRQKYESTKKGANAINGIEE